MGKIEALIKQFKFNKINNVIRRYLSILIDFCRAICYSAATYKPLDSI